ncbi:MAG: hypothetical protein KGJ34_02510 [Patescibacteria group bacterium]|nr:hypothetical protein [Patescibacteria group bacterium]
MGPSYQSISPTQFRDSLVSVIVQPLILLLFGVALLVFAWGIVEFLIGLSSGSEQKDSGKRHMLWGIIGLVIMTGAYAIINIVLGTFGVYMPTS